MTREKAIEYLEKLYMKADITDEYGDMDDTEPYETALNMAIEALDERKVELFDDGTLVVNVKEGEKVGRVLIEGDDHFGGLYYADEQLDEQLYVFAVPDAMIDHEFNDDVAITWATNKAEAIEKFSKYYNNIQDEEVSVVRFNRGGVSILTDY